LPWTPGDDADEDESDIIAVLAAERPAG